MKRKQRLLTPRTRQREKQSDDRHQANFRESYLDHMVETAHVAIRHFANPIVLQKKRKKPKHDNLDAVIAYLHDKIGLDTNRKRYREPDDILSSMQRRRKRRKLRHCMDQIRNDEESQNAFYKSCNYANIYQDLETDTMNVRNHNKHYCIWKFNHEKNEAQQTVYESDHRCVLCLKYEADIYSLQKHVICWHSKLSFDIRIVNDYLSVIDVKCKATNESYLQLNNRDLNEYYYGWINIWNDFYLRCDANMRLKLNEKYVMKPTAIDTNIDIAKLYALKWDFHHKLAIEMRSRKRMNSHHNILDTFSLSCNQFKNRNISSLTNKEKLSIVDEVLKYPQFGSGRMSKLCKFIALPNTKYLKKLMAIYPMLLLLNKKEIALHLISKWTQWKCSIKKKIAVQNITNNNLKQITMKQVLRAIRDHEKGLTDIATKYKLWLCFYILRHGGKSFICRFRDHLETLQSLNDADVNNTYIANSSLYNIYYNFCGHMMLCGQFPLTKEGQQALNKWWKEVRRVFGFGCILRKQPLLQLAQNKTALKEKEKKKRVVTLKEKVSAIRDIVYNEKDILVYMNILDVKQKTILGWIKNCKKILQKCEAEASFNLDEISGIYDDTHDSDNDVQFKAFMMKAMQYLSVRKANMKRKTDDSSSVIYKQLHEMDHNTDGDHNSEDSEYDPMNESASNRRIASLLNPKSFERKYKTRNVNLRRGRIESHELKFNKGYYHGSTFGKVRHENVDKYIKCDSDTENECDDDWLLKWESNLLFDFQDISFGEKLMMKYWNEFIRKRNKNRIYASFMAPIKLIAFAESHKNIIAQNNLKLPFLFHCITLWEFGFIEAKCIQEAMHIINLNLSPTK